MSSIERKAFRNYCEDFMKTSQENNKEASLGKVIEVFEVLASNVDAPKNLNFKGTTIRTEDLGPKEIQTFSKLAKKILQNKETEISETQANKIIQNATSTARDLLKKESKESFQAAKALEGVIIQTLMHEKVETSHDSQEFNVEAKNRVKELLKIEQKTAQDTEKELKRATRKANIVRVATFAAMAAGMATLFGFSAALTLFAFPVALTIGVAGIILFAAGYLPWGITDHNLTSAITKKPSKQFDESIHRLEKLESYKQVVEEPNFNEFAQKYRINADHPKFEKFIDLYVLEKNYPSNYQDIQQELNQIVIQSEGKPLNEQMKLLHDINPKVAAFNKNVSKINDLRASLELDPIKKLKVSLENSRITFS